MELFGTAGIRGSAEKRVTPSLALAVGAAVGAEAREGIHDTPEVVIARDGRVTGPALAAAMEAGLSASGAQVLRAGQLPTPALAFAARDRYGVMLTASHNPPQDNGIKLFRDATEFDRPLEVAIEDRIAAEPTPTAWDVWTDPESVDVLDDYLEAVVDYAAGFGEPLDGLRIAVDCGNGMASIATPRVLRDLGGEVVTLNANVDGHFPGRGSKPTPETLTDLREFVADANEGVATPGRTAEDETNEDETAEGFAFGIGHDGDADRIVVVDPEGRIVHEDTVLAILAEHYTREQGGDDPVVVTTPNASGRIDERVQAQGGRVERVRLGALHEGIASVRAAAKAGETPDAAVVFAAEPWKHVHTAFGDWIDGVCSAAVVARLVADVGLDELRDPITERPYRKVSVDCPDDRKIAAMGRLEATLPEAFPAATVSTDHGVRLEFPDASWLLVRPSGTEPYVRLYGESDDVDELVEKARAVVEAAVTGGT